MAGPTEYHWTFGDRYHISFPGGGDPVVEPDHAFTTNEGCASISDANGDLLFYTDGRDLYEGTLSTTTINNTSLGGSSSATHSAIIVPPAGGGSLYHIFTVHDWDNNNSSIGPLGYTAVSVSGSVPTIVSGPTQLSQVGYPQRASERLAAIPHTDCNKYWVISMDPDTLGAAGNSEPTLYAILIDSDAGPTLGNKTKEQPYPIGTDTSAIGPVFSIKFSQDGSRLAVGKPAGVDILSFNRTTGAFTAHSQITGLTGNLVPYGLEFSPNGKYLYYTGVKDGYLNRHTIGAVGNSKPHTSDNLIHQSTNSGQFGRRLGALQLAPNGKIYGTIDSQNQLLEIADPDNATATKTGVQFSEQATQADGNTLTLHKNAFLGLPTFTRISDDCIEDDRCETILANVEDIITERCDALVNKLDHCDDTNDCDCSDNTECKFLDVPAIKPCISIRWGDSDCDGLETDDFEVMCISVCNCYSNLTFSNFIITMLEVVDQNGDPVQTLPDGSPSVQIYPIGPHCFGDIPSCGSEKPNCITREFVVKTCGAVEGDYEIRLTGICFEVAAHINTSDCLKLTLCKS